MEEQSGKAVACFGIDDDTTEPPSKVRRSDLKRVDFADWNCECISAGGAVRGCRRRSWYEVSLLRWTIAFQQVDLDVCILCIT